MKIETVIAIFVVTLAIGVFHRQTRNQITEQNEVLRKELSVLKQEFTKVTLGFHYDGLPKGEYEIIAVLDAHTNTAVLRQKMSADGNITRLLLAYYIPDGTLEKRSFLK